MAVDSTNNEILSVCHIVSGDLWGGAEALVFHLLSELQKNKNLHLNVIVHNEGELCERLRNVGVRVTVIDEKKHNFFQLVIMARFLIEKENVKIIHSHRYKENWVALLASKLSRKKVNLIQTVHGLSHPRPEVMISKIQIYSFFDALFRRLFFNLVVVVSEELFQTLAKSGVSHKLHHIPNGISLESANFSITEGSFQSRAKKTVAVVGRLVRVKNIQAFLRAIPQILSERNDLNFLVVGDGPERKALEKLVDELGIAASVDFKGYVSDMEAWWPKIDVYVLCSLHEGLSIALLEAMSHGIPVVATAVGGNVEVVQHGINGFLTEGVSVEAISNACLEVLGLSRDKELSIRRCAQQTVSDTYSSTACAKKCLELYRELLSPDNILI